MNRSRTQTALALMAMLVGTAWAGVVVEPAGAVTQPGLVSTRLPLPSDALASNSPNINAMSCGAAGDCVAVGTYRVHDNTFGTVNVGLIETLAGGVWTPMRAPAPQGVTVIAGSLDGVSCFSATTCAAYGSDATGPSTSVPVVVALHGSTWKASEVTAPGGVFPTPGGGSPPAISGVGCSGENYCAVAGNEYVTINSLSYLRGWTASVQSGTLAQGKVAPTPVDATGQASTLTGLACGGSLCQAAGTYISTVGPEPLVVSVDPSADTSNSPTNHPGDPAGATEINHVDGIACDSGGACAAYGSYYTSGGSNAEGLVMPVGGSSFQPQQPVTPTAASTSIHPAATVEGAGCASGTCVLVGYYYDASSQFHALISRFSAGGGVGDSAPGATLPTRVACGAAAFCTAIGTTAYGQPVDVLTGSGWVAANLALPQDAIASALTSTEEGATACDSATSCWVLGTYPATSGNSQEQAAYATRVTPTPVSVPPSVSSSAVAPFALGSSLTFSWHGSAGTSPIDHYIVEVRRAAWNGGFGAWATPSGWGSLAPATTHVTVALPLGDDTCVRVQAVDAAHVASAWSSPRCTARPLDDHALAASKGWTRGTAAGYYLSTYSSTKTYHAFLDRVGAQFDRLALVATKCPTCGKVAVYSGSTLLATVNLYRATTLREAVIALPLISQRTATVVLRVVTSGRPVVIDGLGVSRS